MHNSLHGPAQSTKRNVDKKVDCLDLLDYSQCVLDPEHDSIILLREKGMNFMAPSVRRALLCITMFALALGAVVAADDKADLQNAAQKFTSKEGRFTVSLPGKPKELNQKIQSAVGELTNYLFIVEADQGKTAYLVAYCDFPPESINNSNAKAMLEGGRDSAIKNLQGELISSKEIKLDKTHPGLEFKIKISLGLYRSRAYLVGPRMYQVTILAAEEKATSPHADKFLDSLEVTK